MDVGQGGDFLQNEKSKCSRGRSWLVGRITNLLLVSVDKFQSQRDTKSDG